MIHAVTNSGPAEEILGWLPMLPAYDQYPGPSEEGFKSRHSTLGVLLF